MAMVVKDRLSRGIIFRQVAWLVERHADRTGHFAGREPFGGCIPHSCCHHAYTDGFAFCDSVHKAQVRRHECEAMCTAAGGSCKGHTKQIFMLLEVF